MDRNKALAQLLRQIALLQEEKGVAFKPAAYRRAAKVIEDLTVDVSTMTEEQLQELPGIGPAIASKSVEFVKTGHIRALDDLLAEQGGLNPALLAIENLGPARVRQLQGIGIKTTEDLLKAAQEGKLRDLPRFSELMEKKILESAGRVEERSRRFAREEIKEDAEMLLQTIKKVPGVERAAIAGSYRREKETVGDLDILAIAKNLEKVVDAISKLSMVRDVVAKGDTKISFNLRSGLRVDVRIVHPDQWGSALLYFTGDKEHNIVLRKKAIAKGWKLSEYGLFEGEKVIASKEEKDIYEALGMQFVEPRERSGRLP